MHVDASAAESPISCVPICRLEVTRGTEGSGIPKTTSQVRYQGQCGPIGGNLVDESGIFVDGAQGVVECVFLPLDLTRKLVNAVVGR